MMVQREPKIIRGFRGIRRSVTFNAGQRTTGTHLGMSTHVHYNVYNYPNKIPPNLNQCSMQISIFKIWDQHIIRIKFFASDGDFGE